MSRRIVSRVVAVFVLSLPMGWFVKRVLAKDLELYRQLPHDALMIILTEYNTLSWGGAWASGAVIVAGGYLLVVAVAVPIEAGLDRIRGRKQGPSDGQ